MQTEQNPDEVSITITYTPNWENGHVKKRVDKVLNWAAQFVVGSRGSIMPVRLHSKILNQVFGPKGNPLGDFLRDKFLHEISKSYSTWENRSKEYIVSGKAFEEINAIYHNPVQRNTTTAYVDTSSPLARLQKAHEAELTGEQQFAMRDISNRLWHPLQNIPKKDKTVFWQTWSMPYNYDISACAPSILYQLALASGMPEVVGDAMKLYVDKKGEFRAHVANISGLELDEAKKLINSLFNGARLSKNFRCTAFQMVDQDHKRMEALQQDEQVLALRRSIKYGWKAIERAMNQVAKEQKTADISLRKAKIKWGIYFKYERKVLNAITRELDRQDIRYFTEHDGFRANKEPDVKAIEAAIFSATKLKLKILKD